MKKFFHGMNKFLLCSALSLGVSALVQSQQVYDNFEGTKFVHYGSKNGVLDSLASNPAPNKINPSGKCCKYIRNSEKKFDNVKMSVPGKLADVSPYATHAGNPPQLKMKIYTTAPAGTLVEILLGSKGRNNEYPAGTHSQYQAYTTKSGEWEELSFKFSQIPMGSMTSATEVDQITLLFNPNSNTSDTFYFDDLTGPSVLSETAASPVSTEKAEKK